MEKIKLLPEHEQAYMYRLFEQCPPEIKNRIGIRKVEKGQSFVRTGEPCRSIYIILKGKAAGIDMQLPEKIYEFKEFGPGRFLESLNVFPIYRSTALPSVPLPPVPST